MKQCYACHRRLELTEAPGRRDLCPGCQAPLRCCLNCRHYSPAAPQQCRVPDLEYVRDKRAANFCDDFAFRDIEPQAPETSAERARRKLDDLFRNL